jgi:hypothetical protein
VKNDYVGYVSIKPEQNHSAHHLGDVHQLNEIARIYKIDEIIFCSKDISSQQIIEWMANIGPDPEYKIVPLFLIGTIPLNIFIITNPRGLVRNIFKVLLGKKTWVGYAGNHLQQQQLPTIKKGVITPVDELNNTELNAAAIARINLIYAKDYSASKDVEIFFKCYKMLGKG